MPRICPYCHVSSATSALHITHMRTVHPTLYARMVSHNVSSLRDTPTAPLPDLAALNHAHVNTIHGLRRQLDDARSTIAQQVLLQSRQRHEFDSLTNQLQQMRHDHAFAIRLYQAEIRDLDGQIASRPPPICPASTMMTQNRYGGDVFSTLTSPAKHSVNIIDQHDGPEIITVPNGDPNPVVLRHVTFSSRLRSRSPSLLSDSPPHSTPISPLASNSPPLSQMSTPEPDVCYCGGQLPCPSRDADADAHYFEHVNDGRQ